ncbi:hypothetical protein FACS189428_5320 [Clostridia bacterium]|nr:hypothetical protein FACS189428_5320 [Clostridia bacterium]
MIDTQSFSRTEETLDLQGSFATGVMRSFFSPFQVTKSSSFITVYYLSNLSNIQVEIVDEYGQPVYYNLVNPVSGEQLLIDISNRDTGIYTIYFTNNAGNCIYGEFEILD